MEQLRLEMNDITKIFPGVKALDRVHLELKPGSVHALIGENGAGKSTLMKCLFGLYHPEEGIIKIDGQKVEIGSPTAALRLGISMIQQELTPIPNMSIIDNIWAGRYDKKGFIVDEKIMKKKTEELLKDLEIELPVTMHAKDLSVSQLQSIEIAKAVSYDSKIIIMDEPTSSLTSTETRHLFKIITRLKEEGRTIIYISHKLEEIFEISDEITVMRDGQYVGKWEIKDITIDKLIQLMVGRSLENRFPPNENVVQKEISLHVDNFTSEVPNSFKAISFNLHKGEILGVGGLVGAQRTELVESIFGLRKIISGTLTKNGSVIVNNTPKQAIANGFAMLTEERRATGIIPALSVFDNTLAVAYKKLSGNRFGIISKGKMKKKVDQVTDDLKVKMPNTEVAIQNLSGGNQQKVLICRWLLANSDILILDEPTRGIDVGAKYEIYKIMRELTKAGKSIIMVSSEMPELMGVSDRIMVMCEGRNTGTLCTNEIDQAEVMKLATKFTNKAKEEQ
ncbi:MAG: sugar ABC transporter ATP-binding protein [Lachnospiraceae bacterium]|nr:sugar ABC transporter ATP-binding protein [Lachnospiraceae bacterium]